MASKRLTDIGFPPVPITNDDLIHVVITADTSQNSAGSSYKVKISEISSLIEGNISGDTYVTGFTYDGSNVFTISRNEGKPQLSQVFNSVSGLTVNGNLNITGTTSGNTGIFNNLTAGTFSAGTLSLGGVSYTSIPSGGGSFTGGTVTGQTSFSTGVTISGDLTVLGNIYGLSDVTYQGTGLTVHFSAKTIFNLPTSPENGNISEDTTNAKFGMIQKIYHSGSTEPTVPSSWKLVGDGVYFPNELNIIYAEYVTNSWIEYWIIQQQ